MSFSTCYRGRFAVRARAAMGYELKPLRSNAGKYSCNEPADVGPEKYDEMTGAMIGRLKYGSAVPFLSLEEAASEPGDSASGGNAMEIVEEVAEIDQA